MAFTLPAAIELHRNDADDNVGTILGANLDLGLKNGGNLPISSINRASEMSNQTTSAADGPVAGVFFGIAGRETKTPYVDSSTNRLLIWSVQFNAPNRIQISTLAQSGAVLMLGSGNEPQNNYVKFKIGGRDTPFGASITGAITLCIDLADISYEEGDEVGTFDSGNVSAYGFGTVSHKMVGSSNGGCFFQRAFLLGANKAHASLPYFSTTPLSTTTNTGTEENPVLVTVITYPSIGWGDAYDQVQGTTFETKIGNWISKTGSSYFVPCPISFGDGNGNVNFNDAGASVTSPSSQATGQENFRITNNAMRVHLNSTDSNDTVVLSGSYNWGTEALWDFDTGTTSGTCTLSGVFAGMGNFTLGHRVTATGTFVLANGSSVVSKGATVDEIEVTGTLRLEAATAGTSFPVTLTDITVDTLHLTEAGQYILNNCDIGTVTTNGTTGLVIDLQDVNSNITTITPNEGITRNKPRTASINGAKLDSRIQIYNVTSSSEIYNGLLSIGSTGVSVDAADGTLVDYTVTYYEAADFTTGDEVRVRLVSVTGIVAYKEYQATAVASSTGWTLNVTQEINTVYQELATNGSLITGFTADYNEVDINVALTTNFLLSDFYAWWQFNLMTTNGVRNFFKGVTASDQANFEINTAIVNLFFENVSTSSIYQNDSRRIFRSDETYPVKTIGDDGVAKYGIDLVWRERVYVAETNTSGLTTAESTSLAAVKANTNLIPALL